MSQQEFTETATSVKEDVTDIINANAVDAETRLAALEALIGGIATNATAIADHETRITTLEP